MTAKLLLHFIGLRERLREARAFLRRPLHVRLAAPAAGDEATRVLLYGIPYADWNAPLTDGALWAGMHGVVSVLRLPALPLVSALIARFAGRIGHRCIVIPTKTVHAARLPGGWRSLSPDASSVRALDDKLRFAAYMAENGFGDYCPATYAGVADAIYPCLLKRTDLSSSWGIVVVNSRVELEARLQSPLFKGHPIRCRRRCPAKSSTRLTVSARTARSCGIAPS